MSGRGTIMIAALLLAAVGAPASGNESAAPPPPPKPDKLAMPVKMHESKRGTILTDHKDMTLYYFDKDDAGNKSTCDGKCAEQWIPLAAPDDAKAMGDFTVSIRSDKSKMWAYRYRPLYTSRDDQAPGDFNGLDPSHLWH